MDTLPSKTLDSRFIWRPSSRIIPRRAYVYNEVEYDVSFCDLPAVKLKNLV